MRRENSDSMPGSVYAQFKYLVHDYADDFGSLVGFGGALRTFERAVDERRDSPFRLDTDDGPLSLEIGGDASAIGSGTRSKGEIESNVHDFGGVSIAYGEAELSALSTGSRNATLFADTDVFANVSGADFIFTYIEESVGGGKNKTDAWAGETSVLKVFAIDIEDFDLRGGPLETVMERNPPLRNGEAGGFPRLFGDVAEAHATANANGGDAYALAITDTFASDGFSTLSAYAFGAVA